MQYVLYEPRFTYMQKLEGKNAVLATNIPGLNIKMIKVIRPICIPNS